MERIVGPAGMDPAIAGKIETAVQEILKTEKSQKTLLGHGQYPFLGSARISATTSRRSRTTGQRS